MTDVFKSTSPGAGEVLGEHWPPDSETAAEEEVVRQIRLAGVLDDAVRTAGGAQAYATHEMEGEAAEALARKFGIHQGELNDREEAHRFIAGWLFMLGGAIVATKHQMNAAVEAHVSDHAAPLARTAREAKMNPAARTQAQKDASLETARQAVQAAAENLETARLQAIAGIEQLRQPQMVPKPGANPYGRVEEGQASAAHQPATDPTATAPTAPPGAVASPGSLTDPGLTNPALTDPGLTNPGLTDPGFGSLGTGEAAATSVPRLSDAAMGSAGEAAATPPGLGSGGDAASAMGDPSGMGMPMSGMPMNGMQQPPQMPQMPSQTPGADIAKNAGDTIGKLAGGNGGDGSQAIDGPTLDKLLEANGFDIDSDGLDSDSSDNNSSLSDSAGTVFKDKLPEGAPLPGATTHPGVGGLTNPYSASNANPALNNPAPLVGPSPTQPVVTPPPTGGTSFAHTELSADENVPAARSDASSGTNTAANQNTQANSTNAAAGNGGALGAYSGGGMMGPPMAGGAGMAAGGGAAPAGGPITPAAVPAAATAAGVVAAPVAASPIAREVAAELAKGDERPNLPADHVVAHDHIAGLVQAFRERPGLSWSPNLAIAVTRTADGKRRYLLATADAISLVPLDVSLPAGVIPLGARQIGEAFTQDFVGYSRPAQKLVEAAERFPQATGAIEYLVSTTEGSERHARVGSVHEVVQTSEQTELLIASRGGSPATIGRVVVDPPRCAPESAAYFLDKAGSFWQRWQRSAFAGSLAAATARLWAARWDGASRAEKPEDYSSVLAAYWYWEGQEALGQGRLYEAAYAAHQLIAIPAPAPAGASR